MSPEVRPAALSLVPTPPRSAAVEALVQAAGGRVGLDGVLADLNRRARPAYAPGTLAGRAFTWNHQDDRCPVWWPQGITTSADAGAGTHADTYAGRAVLVTTAYAKPHRGVRRGARISVVDVTEADRIRYRHVLLVAPRIGPDGTLSVEPVPVHAGGAVWHGDYLHVAATGRGLVTFRLQDVVRAHDVTRTDRLGVLPQGGLAAYGFRYVLPVHSVAESRAEDGRPMRYSFISLDRGGSEPGLLAGEYDRWGASTRLVRFDLAAETGTLALDGSGRAPGTLLGSTGVARMQGATRIGSRLYLTASDGPRRRGTLWVGAMGSLTALARSLPAGPEDVGAWPARDQLWSLTEHPGRRLVFPLDLRRVD